MKYHYKILPLVIFNYTVEYVLAILLDPIFFLNLSFFYVK